MEMTEQLQQLRTRLADVRLKADNMWEQRIKAKSAADYADTQWHKLQKELEDIERQVERHEKARRA